MKVDTRSLLSSGFESYFGRIRFIKEELSSNYLYKEEREDFIKELEQLEREVKDELLFIKSDLETIEGIISNLF